MHVAYEANKNCIFLPCYLNSFLTFLDSFFFIAPRCIASYVYYLLCVWSFSYYYVTYRYNVIIFVFSSAQLGCAQAPLFSACKSRNFKIPVMKVNFVKMCI